MSKPTKTIDSHRTSRSRALEIGTSANGFPDNAAGPYNPVAGVPESVAGGEYQPNVTNPGASPSPTKIPDPSPFKLG